MWEINWTTVSELTISGQKEVRIVKRRKDSENALFVLKLCKSSDGFVRFKREIEIRAKLPKHGVPAIVEYSLDGDRPYFIEEYIEDGDLSKNWKSEFSIEFLIKCLQIFQKLCKVIEVAHESNIIHRDLKPANILFVPATSTVLVTDFGIGYDLNNEEHTRVTRLSEIVGSRHYTAPELESGKLHTLSKSADVYSLGKVLYWMLTHRVLPRERHRESEYDLKTVFPHISNYAELISRVLDNCIAQLPSNRFPDCGHLERCVSKVTSLIQNGANVVGERIPQICQYCHSGNLHEHWKYPGRTEQDSANILVGLTKYGFNIMGPMNGKLSIRICDHCGRLEYFIRNIENDSWESPSLPKHW